LATSLELEDVGNWEYIPTAEQAKLQRIPFLAVCTPELAKEMVTQIQKHYDWGGPLVKGKIRLS